MSTQQPLPAPESVFRDDEAVIESQAMMPGGRSPVFGERGLWDFNGVVERPANLYESEWRIHLDELPPDLNLLAREMAMIWFNPRHQAVLAQGIHLAPDPRNVSTVRARIGCLQRLTQFGAPRGLGPFAEWSDDDFKSYLSWRANQPGKNNSTEPVTVIKNLHQFRKALAGGGPASDPWPGRSARQVLALPEPENRLSTAAIAPETWFPLIRAAWAYIDVFSADILRAMDRWRRLREAARAASIAEGEQLLRAWLADPAHRVPVHTARVKRHDSGAANWQLLTWMIGVDHLAESCCLFNHRTHAGRARRQLVEEAVAAGRTQTGLLEGLAEVERADKARAPWHPGLHPHALWLERTALRNACFIFTIALSMMRDNEARAILKDSVVEYFSSPAVKSTKRKGTPELPTKHWWIITPVAKAIDIASQLSLHDDLAFAAVNDGEADAIFDSQTAIDSFIRHVNHNRHHTGLPEVPLSKATPHMFRRTMAMLTRDFPGSEIAVGIQLKHVATRALANRSTQGYMEKDPAWAKYLKDAISERRFERLKELYQADSRGENVGYGPGADRMRKTFQEVRRKAEELRASGKAQRGDIRVEYDLLRRAKFSIRFGKLNHCTMDDSNPVGAKCIEDAIVPEGHKGPLLDRCRPSRCGNSIIAPEHLPIWRAEHASLTRLKQTPKLPPARRAVIDEQIRDVEIALNRVDEA